ncbi:MAG: amidohydrolase family protein [Bacteroidia bacterium]|nr:amidohydrolase family protein [Bacteroidia bacterium]
MNLDAHQHFWKYDPKDYGWISDAMTVIKRDFYPEDLAVELEKAGFSGVISVQARQTLAENDFLLGLAEHYDWIRGVVGWVDLCSEEAEGQLELFAAHPKAVGVRHIIHDEADDDFMLRADFRRGIGLLQKYRMTYDLLLFPRHLPRAIELVAEFPEQPFVLDHISKPPIRSQSMDPWKKDIGILAGFSHVCCKLSGMVTETVWGKWKPEDFFPYLDVVMDVFGEDRLMIGSDWPVCKLSGEYGETMGIVRSYLSHFSEHTQQKILGGNAEKFYLRK